MNDRILRVALNAATAVCALLLVLIVGFLILRAAPALQAIDPLRFLTDSGWYPRGDADTGRFGLGPMLLGSLAITLGAVLLASPFGIASALFCHFYAPVWLSSGYRRLVEILAGIPSVLYGFWGLTVLAPLIAAFAPPGQSLLAGILVVAVMIVPTIAMLADAAIGSVPRTYIDGAAALGLSRDAIAFRVALPSARAGISGAVVLAAARAIGETLAVLMVCGNVAKYPGSIFDPVRAMTANIALELSYASGLHASALFVTGLILMLIVIALLAGAERMTHGHLYGE